MWYAWNACLTNKPRVLIKACNVDLKIEKEENCLKDHLDVHFFRCLGLCICMYACICICICVYCTYTVEYVHNIEHCYTSL